MRAALIDLHEQIGGILEKAGDIDGALESYRKALAVLDAWLSAKPGSTQVLRLMASEHADIGKVYETLASDMKTAASERREAWRLARASYQYSFEIWQQMRGQG